jgi:archaeosine synthase
MKRFEAKKRDGLARTGVYRIDGSTISLPAAVDTDALFPALREMALSNLPFSAPAAFAQRFPPPSAVQPVIIHPAIEPVAESGDCVMAANWHTTLSNPRACVDWLIALKEKVPPDTVWYAPATALPSNVHLLCSMGFDLFDFAAVDLKSSQGIFCMPEGELDAGAMERGICSCPGCAKKNLQEHNRHALNNEIARVARFIALGRIRDLLESRCRMDAAQVAAMRHLDRNYTFMEERLPIARSGMMRANSAESMQRAEVIRFMDRVGTRYRPPSADVAVLLPCSAKKPYSLSQSHRKFQIAIRGRAHELIVTSPLGLVPRELETVYPAGHYDVPVTGYWDAEECAVIAHVLERYFVRNKYRRVIAHLEGGALKVAEQAAEVCGISLEYSCREHPTSDAALNALDAALAGERKIKDHRLAGMASYQFNCQLDTKGVTQRGSFPEVYYSRGTNQIFSIDTGTGLLRPTFDGWEMVPEDMRVYIDDFVPEGDILAPGVVKADPEIRDGDEVLVVGAKARVTGRAAMPGREMMRSKQGVAVRTRKIKRLYNQTV